jgi:hypothetical protein
VGQWRECVDREERESITTSDDTWERIGHVKSC